MTNIITYGTFDCLHYGHIELLRRAKLLAGHDKLIVGLSSDEFNKTKGKKSVLYYNKRKELLEGIKYIDEIISEDNREQKLEDIIKYGAQLVMGDDWLGKFDNYGCIYLRRTPDVSSTLIKKSINENKSTI